MPRLSDIPLSASRPAQSDTIVGVKGGARTDARFTVGQLAATIGTPETIFDTRADAAAASIGAFTWVQTQGYYAVGDGGGGLYQKVSGSTPGGFQAADGSWWALNTATTTTAKQFGAKGDGVTDDSGSITTAIAALSSGQELQFPVGIYLCANPIVNGGTLPYGITFRALGEGWRTDTAAAPTLIKFTGTGICWNIQEALGTGTVGGWHWVGFGFQATEGSAGMFAFNDVSTTPTNDASSQNFISEVKFSSCKFWGAGAAGSQTGNGVQALKLFHSIFDEDCFFTGWKRAIYFHGCDNNNIAGRFGGSGPGNVRHIQMDADNTFGNANVITARFFGVVEIGGPETAYGIYDNGNIGTTIISPFLEMSCPGMLYLDGNDAVVINPIFSFNNTASPNNILIRMGANMRMNTIFAPNSSGAVGGEIADNGATTYSWDGNSQNYGLLLVNPSERIQQNVGGLLSPRIRQIASCYVNGPRSYDPRLNVQSGGPGGLTSPVKVATALEPEMLQSAGLGFAGWSPVADANARNGYAIRLSTTNLSAAVLSLVVGKDAQIGNTVIVETRYRTIGTRSAGSTRATFTKNGANIGNYALTDGASYTILRDIQDLSGFADGDVFAFGVYNANSDIPANVEYIQLFVIDKNSVSALDAGVSPDQGNASIRIFPNVGVDGRPYTTFKFDTPLTVARTVTLETGYSTATPTIRILRTANCTGAFNLDIGSGPLISLYAANQWADVAYDGAAWRLVGHGSLTPGLYQVITPQMFGAKGDGSTDDTAAVQAAFDAAFVVAASNADTIPPGNKELYFPPGIYKTTSPITHTGLFGGRIRGAGRLTSRIKNTGGGDCIQTNGCEYTHWSDLALESTGGKALKLDWNGSGAALQQNVFQSMLFSGGTYGVTMAESGHQGDTNTFVECFFINCTTAGVWIAGSNVIATKFLGGDFQANGIGILTTLGGGVYVYGTDFQTSSTCDIQIDANEDNTTVILGADSESANFLDISSGNNCIVEGASHRNGGNPGYFVKSRNNLAGSGLVIKSCTSVDGQVIGYGTLEGCEIGRDDWTDAFSTWNIVDRLLAGLTSVGSGSGTKKVLQRGTYSMGTYYPDVGGQSSADMRNQFLMDDANVSGTTIVGSNFNGTASGAGVTSTAGPFTQARNFDGASYISLPSYPLPRPQNGHLGTEHAVFFWAKVTDITAADGGAAQTFLGINAGNQSSYPTGQSVRVACGSVAAGQNNGELLVQLVSDGGVKTTYGHKAAFSSGVFAHVGYTAIPTGSGYTVTLYLNGTAVATDDTFTAIGEPTTGTSQIGTRDSGGGHLTGAVYDLRIFGRIPSAAEIAAMVNPGFAGLLAFGAAKSATFSGEVKTPASTTSTAGVNVATGSAPTSPVDGDMWQDGTHAYMRVGGVTKQLDN